MRFGITDKGGVFMKKQFLVLFALAVALFTPLAAMATDLSDSVTAITAQIVLVSTAVSTIGAAVVLIFLAIKTFKWLRRSL
jgi:hypothetical protein